MPRQRASSTSPGLRLTERADLVLVGQHLGIVVEQRIEVVIGLPVAPQKVLQARQGGRARMRDQHHATGPRFDQGDAAQDQRARDALAQVGLGDEQGAQGRRCDQQRFDGALGLAIDQRRPARQLPHLGQEVPPALLRDGHHLAQAVALGDGHHACQHHEHARPQFARGEEPLAMGVAAHRAEAAHALDLFGSEHGEHLMASGFDEVGGRVGCHGVLR
jgi:hypothetical protein